MDTFQLETSGKGFDYLIKRTRPCWNGSSPLTLLRGCDDLICCSHLWSKNILRRQPGALSTPWTKASDCPAPGSRCFMTQQTSVSCSWVRVQWHCALTTPSSSWTSPLGPQGPARPDPKLLQRSKGPLCDHERKRDLKHVLSWSLFIWAYLQMDKVINSSSKYGSFKGLNKGLETIPHTGFHWIIEIMQGHGNFSTNKMSENLLNTGLQNYLKKPNSAIKNKLHFCSCCCSLWEGAYYYHFVDKWNQCISE